MQRRSFLQTLPLLSLGSTLSTQVCSNEIDEDFITLTATEVDHRLGAEAGPDSKLWLYDGQLPGPEIRVKKGERVKVRFHNKLKEPSTIHWHGIRIENAMDGVSGLTQPPVLPGEFFDYDFLVPDAGTYWYHAHHQSWNQVPRGLFGPLIIDDVSNQFDREHDITLVLNDWLVDKNDVLDLQSLGSPRHFSHAGRLGNFMTVNGVSKPDINILQGHSYRLRLINASSARVLTIDPANLYATVIALDGQTLPSPIDTRSDTSPSWTIAPGQRIDLEVKIDQSGVYPMELILREPFVFANIRVNENKDIPAPPASSVMIKPNDLPEPDLKAATVINLDLMGGAMGEFDSLVFKGEKLAGSRFVETGQFWGFNGIANMTKDPLFKVQAGTTIKLESHNNTAFPHAIHIHGHHFQLLEKNPNQQNHKPWRDTFLLQRDEYQAAAFVADNPGKWLIHCHMLGHAASGMMTWFEVT